MGASRVRSGRGYCRASERAVSREALADSDEADEADVECRSDEKTRSGRTSSSTVRRMAVEHG